MGWIIDHEVGLKPRVLTEPCWVNAEGLDLVFYPTTEKLCICFTTVSIYSSYPLLDKTPNYADIQYSLRPQRTPPPPTGRNRKHLLSLHCTSSHSSVTHPPFSSLSALHLLTQLFSSRLPSLTMHGYTLPSFLLTSILLLTFSPSFIGFLRRR